MEIHPGHLDPIDVKKYIAAKGLFYKTRPNSLCLERNELMKDRVSLFDAKIWQNKIEIFKEYALSDARKAHEILGARKIIGPALLIPNE